MSKQDLQDQFRALITGHCETLACELLEIKTCLDGLGQPGVVEADAIAKGFALAHKVKGSSGTLGFAEICAAAETLEHYLRDLGKSGAALGPSEREQIFDHYDLLACRINAISPEQSSLFNA
ncbi:MAG: Hpt domain-containing protein [Alphaproteobacteria bacterium]